MVAAESEWVTTEWPTHDGFKAVGESVFNVEVVTEVGSVSVQDEMLQTNLLHKQHKQSSQVVFINVIRIHKIETIIQCL